MLGHQMSRTLASQFDTYVTLRSPHRGLLELNPTVKYLDDVRADNIESVAAAIARVAPDAVINCIGIVKQHHASKDVITSLTVNALFPHQVAKICQAAGHRFIHISTDCVFSGDKGNYREDDFSDAKDLYGRTKYLGEVHDEGCVTIRTSIIGHELGTHHGLLEWFLSNQGGKVRGFRHAIFSGLTTLALTQVIAEILVRHPHLHGLWQVASEPINKLDLLLLIRQVYRLSIEIEPELNFRCDRSLRADVFHAATGWSPEPWLAMVEAMRSDHEETRRPLPLAS